LLTSTLVLEIEYSMDQTLKWLGLLQAVVVAVDVVVAVYVAVVVAVVVSFNNKAYPDLHC
jgi:hypothetical protein